MCVSYAFSRLGTLLLTDGVLWPVWGNLLDPYDAVRNL